MKWRFWKKNGQTPEEVTPIVQSPSSQPTESNRDEHRITTSEVIQYIGNGRYQVFVNILMGMISFADVAEIYVTAIIILDLACEWNLTALQKALIPAAILTGAALGSFIGGKVADSFGRKSILIASYYFITVASIISITATNYYVYIASRACCGFGISVSYPISACYIHEFSVVKHRTTGVVQYQTIGALGGVYACVVSLLVMGLENGWRWELTLVLVPVVVTLIVLHFSDESPRYYLASGQQDKAVAVLRKIARTNGVELPDTMLPTAVEPQSTSYMEVYQEPYTRMSVIMTFLHFSWAWCYTGICYFIPDAFTYAYCYLSDFFQSTYVSDEGCILYTKSEYLFYLVIVTIFIPGIFIGGFSTEYFGRKPTAIWTNWALVCLYILLLICVHWTITLFILILCCLILGGLTVLIWTMGPELYPSHMRTTSNGLLNTFNRLGAAGGAFFTEYVDPYNMYLVIGTYIFFEIITGIACLFINVETKGLHLKDTDQEETQVVKSNGSSPEQETSADITSDKK